MAIDVTVSGLNTVVDVEFAESPSDIPPETYIALRGEKGDKGDTGAAGQDGADGADGFSPIATVSKVGDTATISITDENGTTTANVYDGANGVMPYYTCNSSANSMMKTLVSVSSPLDAITTGCSILVHFENSNTALQAFLTFPDATWTEAEIRKGRKSLGQTPETSWSAYEVVMLTYDGTYWQMNDWQKVPVTDVKVDGSSVVSIGVATIPKSGYNQYGVVQAYDNSEPPAGVLVIKNDNKSLYAPTTYFVEGEGFKPIRPHFLPDATTTAKGAMSASDKAKLDSIGSGVPDGGTTGQVLSKASGTDYDLEWVTPSGGDVTDVQVDGTSIVDSDGIAVLETVTELRDGLMTAVDKQKLDGVESGAEVNVQSDWNEADSTSDAYIANKPAIHNVPSGGSSGQVLSKASGTDYDLAWVNQSGGGGSVTDVEVDGTSVVTGGVASIDLTGKSDVGHTHTKSAITDFPTDVSSFVNDSGYITSPNVVYCICSTASGTVAKVATIKSGSLDSLNEGDQAIVKFSNANTASNPTLKIGNTTAKSIKKYGTTAPSSSTAGSWNTGSAILFVYDGTYWQMIGFLNSTYSEISEANITNGSGSSTGLVSGRRAKKAVETFAPVKSVNGNTGAVTITLPENLSDLNNDMSVSDFANDAGYITGYTETDPVFSASAASGISSSDISTWNGKSDFSGSYNDLTDKPTIPTVNNATLTIQKNGTTVNTFTANASSNVTANITVPTVTDTYSGTSSDGMSGKAVKSAIDALDGTISGSAGTGKTLTAFSQTDGKVSATFGNISITKSQVSDFPTIPTITDTYSGTSQDGMSGIAVKSAIDALDGTVSGTAGAGKTLTAFSQTDGKVSATFGSISITKSQVSDFPSLATVATSGDYGDLLNKPTFSGSTATKTPTEVKTAIDSGNFIDITHFDPVYGLIQATNFNYSADASVIVANVVFYYSLVGLLCFALIGNLHDDTWTTHVYVLAQTSDIPTVSKTAFTPISGTSYANYGGCYYETYGNIVHIHIGVVNLTANTATIVYNIPAAIRPASPIFAHGTGGSWNNIGYLEVQTSGDLYVRSQGTGCGADAVYLI